MTTLLFQTPWWLPTLLIGVGFVLFWNGNRQGDTKLRNVGSTLIALAIVICTISYLVDTDIEKCTTKTKQLVHDVEKQDWNDMKTILSPNATLRVQNSFTPYASRDAMIEGAKAAVNQYGVKNVRILSTEATQADTVITVSMAILSDHDNAAVSTLNSGWQFEWQQSGGEVVAGQYRLFENRERIRRQRSVANAETAINSR